MADPSVRLCDEANVDGCGYVHIADEVLRSLIVCVGEGKRGHYRYMFLHAALAKCERCLAFWLMAPVSVVARRVIRIGLPWTGLVLPMPVRKS